MDEFDYKLSNDPLTMGLKNDNMFRSRSLHLKTSNEDSTYCLNIPSQRVIERNTLYIVIITIFKVYQDKKDELYRCLIYYDFSISIIHVPICFVLNLDIVVQIFRNMLIRYRFPDIFGILIFVEVLIKFS